MMPYHAEARETGWEDGGRMAPQRAAGSIARGGLPHKPSGAWAWSFRQNRAFGASFQGKRKPYHAC